MMTQAQPWSTGRPSWISVVLSFGFSSFILLNSSLMLSPDPCCWPSQADDRLSFSIGKQSDTGVAVNDDETGVCEFSKQSLWLAMAPVDWHKVMVWSARSHQTGLWIARVVDHITDTGLQSVWRYFDKPTPS